MCKLHKNVKQTITKYRKSTGSECGPKNRKCNRRRQAVSIIIICINELNVLGNELNVWSRVNYRWGQMQTVCLQPLQTICMQCICSRVAFTRRPPFFTYSRLLQNFLRRLLHSQFVNFIHTITRRPAADRQQHRRLTQLKPFCLIQLMYVVSSSSPAALPPRVAVYNM